MSKPVFISLARDSILFAIFKAETEGISATQIELWLQEFNARK